MNEIKKISDAQFDIIKNLCDVGKQANKNDAIIGYMVSIKNIADAFLFDSIEENPNHCDHPKNKRNDTSVMGKERWECTICGYQYEEGKEE